MEDKEAPRVGDYVEQVMPAPVRGVISGPLIVDQVKGVIQYPVTWTTTDGDGGVHEHTSVFTADQIRVLTRA